MKTHPDRGQNRDEGVTHIRWTAVAQKKSFCRRLSCGRAFAWRALGSGLPLLLSQLAAAHHRNLQFQLLAGWNRGGWSSAAAHPRPLNGVPKGRPWIKAIAILFCSIATTYPERPGGLLVLKLCRLTITSQRLWAVVHPKTVSTHAISQQLSELSLSISH